VLTQVGPTPDIGRSVTACPALSVLTAKVRDVLTAGRFAHLVTINADSSPQVSIVWVGLEGDEIVSGHLGVRQLRNVERDLRVVSARARATRADPTAPGGRGQLPRAVSTASAQVARPRSRLAAAHGLGLASVVIADPERYMQSDAMACKPVGCWRPRLGCRPSERSEAHASNEIARSAM
jgi:hypothetical protein